MLYKNKRNYDGKLFSKFNFDYYSIVFVIQPLGSSPGPFSGFDLISISESDETSFLRVLLYGAMPQFSDS